MSLSLIGFNLDSKAFCLTALQTSCFTQEMAYHLVLVHTHYDVSKSCDSFKDTRHGQNIFDLH